jgi:hypothetical protein
MPHPPGYGHLSAYALNFVSGKHVVFVTLDASIRYMSLSPHGAWQDLDLGQLTGAPRISPVFTVGGYGWNESTQQIVFGTDDGHVQEITGGPAAWFWNDITANAGSPPAVPGYAIQGYGWDGNSKQVIYGTADGHIHELYYVSGTQWHHVDLMQMTQAPAAFNGVPIHGYSWNTNGHVSKHVVYGRADGHIHHLQTSPGQPWYHSDLTAKVGAPPASSSFPIYGFVWSEGGYNQVLYGTDDGHLHELNTVGYGDWSHTDLTTSSGAPPASSSFPISGYGGDHGKYVVYGTDDGHVHELTFIAGLPWVHRDLTVLAGAPVASGNYLIQGYNWKAEGVRQVIYGSEMRHVHELFSVDNNTWVHIDLTAAAAAPDAMP